MDQTSPSEFRFAVDAPGLEARERGGEVFFSPATQNWMFRLGKVTAIDANGMDIPASLSLKDSEVVIRLDRQALSNARAPIAVDPAIEGVSTDVFTGAHTRKVFQLHPGAPPHGQKIIFIRQVLPQGPKAVYRISSDNGQTWDSPVVIGESGGSGEVTAIQTLSDSFLIAYSSGSPELPTINFRRLGVKRDITESGEIVNLELGPERVVTAVPLWWQPFVTLVDRGGGPLGHRFAVGFSSYNQLLNRIESKVAFSEDGGATWVPTTCATDAGAGILAVQDDRTLCITARFDGSGLEWRNWDGVSWSAPSDLTPWGFQGLEMPSVTWSSDGTVHLVAESWGNVFHTSLAPEVNDWTNPVVLGQGRGAVIATNGIDLRVLAYDPLSAIESMIRTWTLEEGGVWMAGPTMGGRALSYVLDKNQSWAFVDQPQQGDMLFSLIDPNLTGGWIGNRIGTSRPLHALDSASKKLSFGFEPQSVGIVDQIKIWATASSAPAYRVGLQSDSGGDPNGWLMGEENGVPTPSFRTKTFVNAEVASLVSISIPRTPLSVATRYHVVVEPISSGGIGASNYAAIESVGADAQATFNFGVKTKDGSAPWDPADGEVPRVVLSGPSGVVFSQEIIPRPYTYGAMEYVVTGESFVAPQSITPTDIRIHLVKTGNPSAATIKLFDSTNTQLWSATTNPASSGWVNLSTTGLNLTSGNRYRLLVDHDSRNTANYWALLPSGAGVLSWGGTTSALTSSHARPGFSNRSAEASDSLTNPWFRDFVAFDSSATDELYLGDDQPFKLATIVRLITDGGGAVPTSWSYSVGGTDWTTLTLSRNEFLSAGFGGSSEWTLPTDWVKTTVNGQLAYWVKIVSTAGIATPILVQRATAIENRRNPSTVGTTDRPSSGRIADQP